MTAMVWVLVAAGEASFAWVSKPRAAASGLAAAVFSTTIEPAATATLPSACLRPETWTSAPSSRSTPVPETVIGVDPAALSIE